MKLIKYYLLVFCMGWVVVDIVMHVHDSEVITISEHDYMLIHHMGYVTGVKSCDLSNWPTDSLSAVKTFHNIADATEQE